MRHSSRSEILHSIEEKVKEIDYDFSCFTVQDFAQWVANKRGIENIHLNACDGLALPLGFWFMSEDGAHVIYSSSLPPTLKTITILHELMHIYLGHKTRFISSSTHTMLGNLLQNLQGVSTRDSSKQNTEDLEAETGAFLVYQRCLDSTGTSLVSDIFSEAE